MFFNVFVYIKWFVALPTFFITTLYLFKFNFVLLWSAEDERGVGDPHEILSVPGGAFYYGTGFKGNKNAVKAERNYYNLENVLQHNNLKLYNSHKDLCLFNSLLHFVVLMVAYIFL